MSTIASERRRSISRYRIPPCSLCCASITAKSDKRNDNIHEERRHGHQWNSHESVIQNFRRPTRDSREIAWNCRIEELRPKQTLKLFNVMNDGEQYSHNTQKKNVRSNPSVILPQGKSEEKNLRIEENPLIPAVLTRSP